MTGPLALLAVSAALFAPPPTEGRDLLSDAGPALKRTTRVAIPPDKPLSDTSPWQYDPATGVLTCRGDQAGHEWLRFDEEQGDGVFHVEWRFVPVEGKKGYNSGVLIRNSADGQVWHQAQTGGGSGGYLFGVTPVDGVTKMVRLNESVLARPEKPPGEWNTYEIACEGPKLTLTVNGEKASVWDGVAVPRGFLGLEAEGWHIEFRNVRFRPSTAP